MSVTIAPEQTEEAARSAAPRQRRGVLWSEALRAFAFDLKKRGYSLLTLRDYRGDVAQLSTLTTALPHDVDGEVIAEALRALKRTRFGDAVLRRKRAAHHAFVQFLKEQNREEPLSVTLWKRAQGEPPSDRVMLGLLIAAGVRLCEIPAMEGRDVRLRANTIRIRSGLRILPLHPALRALFAEVHNAVPLVAFRPLLPAANGYPVNGRTMHARFRKLVRRLGFPSLRPDEVRRDVAAHLIATGVPAGLVAAFLARDRGRPVAPRRGGFLDLTCIEQRLAELALPVSSC